jgi:DNA-binding transcriptional regulator GbsR (MarR family)
MAPRSPEGAHEALHAAQDAVAELFGDIAAFWGFTRTQGRIYGLLFLSADPLGHTEVRDRLSISAGSTSMTLASLVHWGVIRRRGRLYEAETDMWKVITGVFRRRERDQVSRAIARVDAVLEQLRGLDDRETTPAVRFARARVEQLSEFFELGRRFLDAFVSQGPIAGLLSTIAQRAAKFRSPTSPSALRH